MTAEKDYTILLQAAIEKPLFSCVVPIYNMADNGYLEALFHSFRTQDCTQVEYVLVDDCSEDASVELCLSFAEARRDVTVIQRQANGRQGAARNSGIRESRGKYILFVDADDMISSDYCSSMAAAAVATSADCVVHKSIQNIDKAGRTLGGPANGVEDPSLLGVLSLDKKRKLVVSHWKFGAYRRVLFQDESNLYPEDMAYEDTPTMIRWISSLKSVAQADSGTYYYRIHDNSTVRSTGKSRKLLIDRLKSSDLILENARITGLYGDSVEYYYVRVALVNTLGMLGLGQLDYATELSNHVRRKVNGFLSNPYHLNRSFAHRMLELLAWRAPRVYVLARVVKTLLKR